MKLQKTAAIAEIVSSIAIVLTLVYLAIQTQELATQTQQTNEALNAASRQATMSADVSIILAALEPEIAELDMIPYEEMTEVQRQLRTNELAAIIRVREFAWFQYKNGTLDQATWDSYLSVLRRFIREPAGAEAWDRIASEVDPGFVEVINQYVGL